MNNAVNTAKIIALTQKIMDLQFYILRIKDQEEISKAKEEIMWIVSEINIIEKDLDQQEQ